MEPTDENEDTVQRLCAEADAEHNQGKVKDVRARLEVFLHEHSSLLTSMSEDTYQALRKLKRRGVPHRA